MATFDFDKDFEDFIQALEKERLDKDFAKVNLYYTPRDFSNRLVVTMVKHLSYEKKSYPFPSPLLNNSQLLTIQKFLNSYGFHIESASKVRDFYLYTIVPNWK